MAAARAMLPPSKWMMRLGRTGAMMPKARKSERTVTRMKMKAARLAWGCGVGGAVEDKVSSKGMGDCSGERKKVTEESTFSRRQLPALRWDALKRAPTPPW